MADQPEGSIAARCIHFARQGMVAFSYDMTGYNDTIFPDHAFDSTFKSTFYQRHRRFATNEVNLLWNIHLMGLQSWNSIRALDFLESLPDVDKSRLACTGESGGGTQTYILGAIDDRLAVQAPVVMVSHSMQGGCSCENAPGLRVNHSNVEIAAVAAPRPQIIVAATGDWTKDTMTMEGPSIAGIYNHFKASERFHHVMFDFRHNYNQTSREAVYAFFAQHLRPVTPLLKELPYTKEPDATLRVFPEGQLPESALPEQDLIQRLQAGATERLERIRPTDKKSLARFKELMAPAWRHTLLAEMPPGGLWTQTIYVQARENYTAEKIIFGRNEKGDRILSLLLSPLEKGRNLVVILAHPEGLAAYLDREQKPSGLAKMLLEKRVHVLLLDTFLTGEACNPEVANARSKQVELFFTTYNKTDTQERVQDLITAAGMIRQKRRHATVALGGAGLAGLWALLAAPAADAVVVDLNQLDVDNDVSWLHRDVFVPGIRLLGGVEGVATLAAPNPLLIHNLKPGFSDRWLREVYAGLKTSKSFMLSKEKTSEERIADWLTALK